MSHGTVVVQTGRVLAGLFLAYFFPRGLRTEAYITESGGSVADLGEWGLIAALAARMPPGPFAELGIGDDSAVVAAPSGSVVAAVDLLLEGAHFLLAWSSAYDIGVKAAARSLADIAAMGAMPTALLVALAAPGTLPAQWALDLAAGLAAEAGRAGAGVVGGDTARADLVLLSVTALGDLCGRAPVRRAGARPGDVVAVAGSLGHSAAGHALLAAGVTAFPDLTAAHLRPAPPYEAGPEAAKLGATAMIDVSDGLVADVGHVADASGVWININSSVLVPGDTLARAAAAVLSHSYGTEPAASPASLALRWALTGGEDHCLVATFPPSAALPARWRVIGWVREATAAPQGPGSGAGSGAAPGRVTVDGVPYAGPGGWEHFRGGSGPSG
jgi:thiamine-monophosphate kinase